MTDDKPTRRLNILGCQEVYRGQGAKGEYVIYEVHASREDGTAIDTPLRAFQDLPRGVGEFTVTPYTNKNNERTFTVSPVRQGAGSPGARLGPKVDELRDRVERLEGQVSYVLRELEAIKTITAQDARSGPPAPAPPAGPSSFGEEAPF